MKQDTTKNFFEGTVFLIILTAVFCVGMVSGVAISASSLVAHQPSCSVQVK